MSGVCYSFQESGSCRYGDNCRFNHGDASGAAGGDGYGASASSYNSGGYNSYQSKPRGVCYNFQNNGDCRYGTNCRFSHDGEGAADGASGASSGYSRPSGGFRSGGGDRQCFTFRDTGDCQYGENCRFAHGDQAPASRGFSRSAGACHQFRDNGSCRYGDDCRFSHDAPAADSAEGVEAPMDATVAATF